jgi:hypothetical protein
MKMKAKINFGVQKKRAGVQSRQKFQRNFCKELFILETKE